MKTRALNLAIEAITAVLLLLWIYTGLSKLIQYDKFRFEAGRSPFLQHVAPWVAVMVPAVELIAAALLISRRTRVAGLYASLFLMTLFTGYVYIMLHDAYDLPCSCGGIIELLTWEQHLLVNCILTLLTAIVILLQSQLIMFNRQHISLS
ncbi:MauE/DoxX family redox-associated membrane protein [Chitinophaga ginsengisoli]|nr:MauE/DoxX family redox-associated membrane protein [Chitinophaga ginsengisoli]